MEREKGRRMDERRQRKKNKSNKDIDIGNKKEK